MGIFRGQPVKEAQPQFTKSIQTDVVRVSADLDTYDALGGIEADEVIAFRLYTERDGALFVASDCDDEIILARTPAQMRELAAFVSECADALEGKKR